MIQFIINDREADIDLRDGRATLKTIRKNLHLTGAKEVCGEGDCGACMVLLGELSGDSVFYKAVNSCLLPTGDLHGKHVVSIEGLNFPAPALGLIQESFVEKFASQCGFCTPGFIIALTAYLLNADKWDEKDAQQAIAGNICRCTGYSSIKRAVHTIGEKLGTQNLPEDRVVFLAEKKIIPEYFKNIPAMLKNIPKKKPAKNGQIVAGGTDIMLQKRDEIEDAEVALSSGDSKLRGIRKEAGHLIVGGGVTMEEFRISPEVAAFFPEAKEAFSFVASLPIRNRATIAGNIVNASPIGDMAVFLLALNPELTLVSGKNRRTVPLRSFYKGYKQLDKAPDEILESIRFALPEKGALVHFEKVSKRPHLDIASVNTGIVVKAKDGLIEKVSISAGGVGPTPFFLSKTCEFLAGKKINEETLAQAVKIAGTEIAPISDIRGSKEYKRLLLGRLILTHFISLFPAETGNIKI